MSIAQNLAEIQERIARAAARAGRNPDEVTLVAVSKTFSAQDIREAHEAGVRHFGENRVQEWEGKFSQVADLDATWHLIGHLQSNKARRAVSLFHAIDSVDSLSLAQKLDRAVECGGLPALPVPSEAEGSEAEGTPLSGRKQPAASADAVGTQHVAPSSAPSAAADSTTPGTSARDVGALLAAPRLPILIEVRLSPELTKSGVHPDELPALAEAILALPHLNLRGLMTIPPLLHNPEDVRPYFRRLRELRDSLRVHLASLDDSRLKPDTRNLIPVLSMGMSYDFEVAIEEGATQVRLGTALFGERTL